MGFKELVKKDNRALINASEFGEEVLWNGKPVVVDLVDDEAESSDFHGINITTKTVSVNADEVEKPFPESFVNLDGEQLRVKDVQEDFGMLEITFYRNES